MRSWFAAMDRDRSGSIASNELANVAIGGLPIGLETAVKLIRIFDVDKNGTIDFYEYAALHKFLLNMQSLFQQQDTNRDGRLSSNEVVTALHAGGFKLSDQAAQALYRKYNRTGFGVNLVEFLALIAHVAQAKSVFEWRDNQKTGQISLTMDAFLEVTSEF
jgi:Ca2+-binding EF-hand superfamily protein